MQTQLAASLFVEVSPGIFVNPGSAVLFTATLFVTLLVYIREDAVQARTFIVGIVAANLTLSLVTLLLNLHLSSPLTIATAYVHDQLLVQNLRAFIIGTGLLLLDVVLIIVFYEFFFRLFRQHLFLRIALSMLLVVTIDTVVFVTATFYGQDNFQQIMVSGLTGKTGAAILYSFMLACFLKVYRVPKLGNVNAGNLNHDIFHILTYRQRYDLLKDELTRDHLTGLFNRRFFDDNLHRELRRAARLGHSLNLIIYDLDHFKQVNDTHGHAVGDKALIAFADAARKAFRAADIPCRYGGEEFVVIMPDASSSAASKVSTRLQTLYSERCQEMELPLVQPTFTAGIATFPADGRDAEKLFAKADARLYKGKHAGRNRVIGVDLEPAAV